MSKIKKIIYAIILTIPLILTGCGVAPDMPTPAQQECDHEWIDLGTSTNWTVVEIYCPKCRLEDTVSKKEWKKIQVIMKVDKEYQEKLKEEEGE